MVEGQITITIMGRRRAKATWGGTVPPQKKTQLDVWEKLARKFWANEDHTCFSIESTHAENGNKYYRHLKVIERGDVRFSFAMMERHILSKSEDGSLTFARESGLKVSGLVGYGVSKNVAVQMEKVLNELFATHMFYSQYSAVVDTDGGDVEIYILENGKPKYNLGDHWIEL